MTLKQTLKRIKQRRSGGWRSAVVYSGLCSQCGKIFWHYQRLRHCSLSCSKGDCHYTNHGYSYLWKKGSYGKPEHREIVEKFIKRKLKKKETIHHINHNRADNRISNLVVVSPNQNSSLNGLTEVLCRLVPQEVLEQLTCQELFENGK